MFSKSGIIFNQTWEDFDVDKELLDLRSGDIFMGITSGGCNILNACLRKPKKIFAIDDNPSQNHLLRLKIACVKTLDYKEFWQFFGEGRSAKNIDIYHSKARKVLPTSSQIYWDKNISIFRSGLFNVGVLKTLSVLRFFIRKLCGVENLKRFNEINNLEEQAHYYIHKIEPKLWNIFTSYVPIFTMLGYGAHLRQIILCYKAGRYSLRDLYKNKQRFLFTHIPINKNYFWHQVMFGGYANNISCPDYLKEENFSNLKESIDSIVIYDGSINSFLRSQGNDSINKFSISDVIEFVSDKEAENLWKEIVRTAKKGGIISYRSFAPDVLPSKTMMRELYYFEEDSKRFSLIEKTVSYNNVYKFIVSK